MMAGVGEVHKLLKKQQQKKQITTTHTHKKKTKKQSGSGKTEVSQFWRLRHSKQQNP